MKPLRAALLLGLVGLLVGWGCRDKDQEIGGGCPIGSVQIYFPTDTLAFLPGDTASSDGWVVVRDGSGFVAPNVEVAVTLLDPIGSISFLNGTNSTDANGRVYFRFRSFNQTGTTTIRAEAGDDVALWPLTVLPARPHVAHLHISISKPSIDTTAGIADSLLICALLTDSLNQGISGIVLPLRASGDRIRLSSITQTDSTGKTCFWWYLQDLAPGHHCLYFSLPDIEDSICVEVEPPPASVVNLAFGADTVYAAVGEDWETVGWAEVRDTSGIAQPGVRVHFGLLELNTTLTFMNAQLRDTTDALGRVYFRMEGELTAPLMHVVLTAAANGATASRRLTVLMSGAGEMNHIVITVGATVLYTDLAAPDSIRFHVDYLVDPDHSAEMILPIVAPDARVSCDSPHTPFTCYWIPLAYGRLPVFVGNAIIWFEAQPFPQ
jgi:hypothetical protein